MFIPWNFMLLQAEREDLNKRGVYRWKGWCSNCDWTGSIEQKLGVERQHWADCPNCKLKNIITPAKVL